MFGVRSCMFTTRDANGEHMGKVMLDPTEDRTPRDLEGTRSRLEQCMDPAMGIGAAKDHVAHLGLFPYPPAFMRLKLTHCFLYVRYDSLHVLDGGITARIIVIVGNWLFYHAGGATAAAPKEWWVRLLNARLAALPRVDDFTHFARPLLDMDGEKKKKMRVKAACNWRCTEYEQLVQQLAYVKY